MKTRRHKPENRHNEGSRSELYDHSFRDLEDLEREELSGETKHDILTATSSTDENENEGLGDGNIGRSRENILSK